MIVITTPEKYRGKTALYERLSNEKLEVVNINGTITKKTDKQSGSIETQQLILEQFCERNDIKDYKHYYDDGFTGANFERPGFEKLLEDIENGIINLVIVKDLSRFGRSDKVPDSVEEFFALKGVRFIAVDDNMDTGEVADISKIDDELHLRAFFNSWYLRDTSKKIRNGKRARAEQGKVMAVYPTYGYQKDPADKNHYIVDPIIAPNVKRIFALAKEGKTPTEIGKILTDEGIPVPSEVVGNNHTRKGAIRRGWNRNTVVKVLQNVTYLGWVSNGNTRKLSYKKKDIVIVPKKDRIIKKDMHDPLVDEATFNLVQNMIESRTATRVKTYDWLLKGLVCCKECGKKLGLVAQKHPNKTTFYLRCNTYACNTHLGLCTPHSNNYEKLQEAVLTQIKKRCMEFLQEEKYQQIANKSKDKFLNSKFSYKNQILLQEKKLEETNIIIDKLYKEKCLGKVQEEDFTRMYVLYTEERKAIKERIERLKQEEEESKTPKKVDIMKIVKEFVSFKEITREMIVALVDRIEITENKEITIYYKFNILNVAELKDQDQEESTLQVVG